MLIDKDGIKITDFEYFKNYIAEEGIEHEFANAELYDIFLTYFLPDYEGPVSPRTALNSCQKMTRVDFLKQLMIRLKNPPVEIWYIERLINMLDENLQIDGIVYIIRKLPHEKRLKVELVDNSVLVYRGFFDE
jgi:pyruvate formate-lyase activating enzyme-like uncharacterized protein